MKSLQAVSADSAPVPVHIAKLFLTGQCSECKSILSRDCMGLYHGAYFCDNCANQLQPDRYNAELFTIISLANDMCAEATGMSIMDAIAEGRIVLIEDDLGDLTYTSLNCREIMNQAPQLGFATTDFLPAEFCFSHRKMHRESIKTASRRSCLQTVQGQHWECQVFPFVAEQETFALTVFQRVS